MRFRSIGLPIGDEHLPMGCMVHGNGALKWPTARRIGLGSAYFLSGQPARVPTDVAPRARGDRQSYRLSATPIAMTATKGCGSLRSRANQPAQSPWKVKEVR